jgi:hypothetical protein
MRATARLFGLGFLLSTGCGAAAAVTPAPTILPLTTVRLYETGMGYFERSGTLSASARTTLPVPASHLDDALESLVVLTGRSSERLRGVEFGSNLSRGMARAMAGLPTGADAPITYRDLLTSLRGAHVEVRTRTEAFFGRLIDIDAAPDVDPTPPAATDTGEKKDAPVAPPPPPLRLVVLTDASSLVRIAAPDVLSVRPTDAAYAARLDAALDALATHSAQSRKMLDLLGATSGPVTLAYVAEAPVWRTSYRFVLDGGDKRGTLQAWALVHNDTDEDWKSVKIELVNGRPDSFLFPMAAPRYARRPLVHPDDQLSTVPQLLDKTVDAIWGDNIDDASSGEGLGLSGFGTGGGGYGAGVGYGRGSMGASYGTSTSNLLTVGDLAQVAQASGTETGALFVYSVPDRLALRAHGSALLPFLQQAVDAEPIAWVDAIGEPARSALKFVNSTSQTLPAGTVTVFGGGGFAGESALDRLKPGERRFIRYGVDLDVETKVVKSTTSDATERLTFDAATLVEHFLRTTDATYAFENRSGHPRAVYVAMHIARNAKLTGADSVDYDAASSTPLAVLRLAPGKRVERGITSVEGLSRPVALASLTAEALAKIVASPGLVANDRAIAAEALARQRELEETRKEQVQASVDLAADEKELARLREDTKALGGDRGAAPPAEFVKRMLAAEDRHAASRKRLEALEAEEKTRAKNVESALAKLHA